MSSETPRVESFVLRLIEDSPRSEAPSAVPSWHGVILHVQTNEEKTFAHFADAVAFIARYVPIGDFFLKTTEDGRPKTEDLSPPTSVLGHSGE